MRVDGWKREGMGKQNRGGGGGGQREEEGWAKMKVLVEERRENVKQREAKGEEAKGGEERRVKMTPLTGCT